MFVRERERERRVYFFIAYLEEIRFFHCIFEGFEAAKIVGQREGSGFGLRMSLLPSETTTITLFYSHIIISRVRIRDYLTYSLAALQVLIRDWTRGLDSCSAEKRNQTKRSKKEETKAWTVQILYCFFLGLSSFPDIWKVYEDVKAKLTFLKRWDCIWSENLTLQWVLLHLHTHHGPRQIVFFDG